jgi:hypothetical protein
MEGVGGSGGNVVGTWDIHRPYRLRHSIVPHPQASEKGHLVRRGAMVRRDAMVRPGAMTALYFRPLLSSFPPFHDTMVWNLFKFSQNFNGNFKVSLTRPLCSLWLIIGVANRLGCWWPPAKPFLVCEWIVITLCVKKKPTLLCMHHIWPKKLNENTILKCFWKMFSW